MALPLIALAVVAGTAIHQSQKRHYRKVEDKRRFAAYDKKSAAKKDPSDTYSSHVAVEPKPGSVVCCEVFGMLDHTGIWIDKDTIVELSENGLVKAVSSERFLQERSGEHIYVACDRHHQPIIIPGAEQRAINSVFSYREYHLINNNCHRFVLDCLTGSNDKITRFQSLNEQLANLINDNIYWDKAKF